MPCAGAPTIASSTGAFVMGNVATKLQSGVLNSPTPAASPPSVTTDKVESQWRLEARDAKNLMAAFDGAVSKEAGQLDPAAETPVPEPPAATPAQPEPTQTPHTDADAEKQDTEQVTETPEEDDIALGYSPSSLTSKASSGMKFDKYYHRSLAKPNQCPSESVRGRCFDVIENPFPLRCFKTPA